MFVRNIILLLIIFIIIYLYPLINYTKLPRLSLSRISKINQPMVVYRTWKNNYVDKKGVVLGADKIDKKLSDSNFIFIPHNTEEDIVRRTWKHLQRKGFPVMLEDAEIRGNKSKLIVVDNSTN